MAQRRNSKSLFHIENDAPVTIVFACVALVMVIFQHVIKEPFFLKLLSCPGKIGQAQGFNWQQGTEYIRLVLHVFGQQDIQSSLVYYACLLLLGSFVEHRYGSLLYCLMLIVTALVSSVINVCFFSTTLQGMAGIALLLLLLSLFSGDKQKSIQLAILLFLVLFIICEILQSVATKNFSVVSSFCGALVASFLSLATESSSSKTKMTKAKTVAKTRQTEKSYQDDDTTQIGTLKF
ncbi:MAG: rhomboid family intramembrane serine protease [Spirochaetaceae bacterium]|nr:rhomboid family intramembrane serine protease [Spirochaetaceae bacterium]